MDLKPMDPKLLMQLLDGAVDVLTPAQEAADKWYNSKRCPLCGSSPMRKTVVNFESTFYRETNDGLPAFQLECRDCETILDPHSGIILKVGHGQIRSTVHKIDLESGG